MFSSTTLDLIPIKSKEMGLIFYDSPGMPNHTELYYKFTNKSDAALLTHRKKLTPRMIQLRKGRSIFLGALCRIDFVESS